MKANFGQNSASSPNPSLVRKRSPFLVFFYRAEVWNHRKIHYDYLLPGLCLDRPGCECQPKKKRLRKVDVIIGTNSSSTSFLCTSVSIEEHRGPCRCKCAIEKCHYNKVSCFRVWRVLSSDNGTSIAT